MLKSPLRQSAKKKNSQWHWAKEGHGGGPGGGGGGGLTYRPRPKRSSTFYVILKLQTFEVSSRQSASHLFSLRRCFVCFRCLVFHSVFFMRALMHLQLQALLKDPSFQNRKKSGDGPGRWLSSLQARFLLHIHIRFDRENDHQTGFQNLKRKTELNSWKNRFFF